jgi:hypothetical protein
MRLITSLSPSFCARQDAARLLPEGCPALAAEFAHSGTRRLLVRDSFLRLRAAVMGKETPALLQEAQALAAAAPPPRAGVATPPAVKHLPSLVLEGEAGSGKSVLLAQLVCAARAAGWLVLYFPRGRGLTERSSFARHGDSAAWDTPEHAKALLNALDAAHGPLLATLPRKTASATASASQSSSSSEGVLRDLVAAGTAPTATASAVVDAALAMLSELALVTQVPVLIAVDELNALSGFSEYHQVTGPKSRTRLEAGALRIAAAVRSFQGAPLARGARVGATSANAGVSPRVHLADVGGVTVRRAVPRLSEAEMRALLAHYGAVGMAPRMTGASPETLAAAAQAMHALCVGSGIALRRAAMLM